MGRKKKYLFESEDDSENIQDELSDFVKEQKLNENIVCVKKKKINKIKENWNDKKNLPVGIKEKIDKVLKEKPLPTLNIKATIKYSKEEELEELLSLVLEKMKEFEYIKDLNVKHSLSINMV